MFNRRTNILILSFLSALLANLKAQNDSTDVPPGDPVIIMPDTDPQELQPDSLIAPEFLEPEPFLAPQFRLNEPFTFGNVEKNSYALYLKEDWQMLLQYSKQSLIAGIDYYFLRVRAGIAAYEKRKYRLAARHFEKALSFDPTSEISKNYLYLCYVKTERFDEAKFLSRSFTPAQAASLSSDKTGAIDFVITESGFKTSDSSRIFKNPQFSSVGLGHSVNRRVFLFHSLSYFRQGEKRFNVEQFQYYLRCNIPFKDHLNLTLAGHLVNVNADIKSLVPSVITTTYQVQGPPPPLGQSLPTGSVYTTVYREQLNSKQSLGYIGAIGLLKNFSRLSLNIGITAASLDTASQVQVNAGCNFFPLLNNRMSVGGNVYLHLQDPYGQTYLAIVPAISWYPVAGLNISAAYLYNTGTNITEYNGYLVSNSVDFTTDRLTLTGSARLASRLWLNLTYGSETKQHISEKYIYHYNIFALGLKFIP
jgi:tetratricopeptide (TPR) repeat protein